MSPPADNRKPSAARPVKSLRRTPAARRSDPATTTTTMASDPCPARRCCPSHADWTTLAQHLIDEFPELAIDDVVRELQIARDAAESTGLSDTDSLETAELITRHQLHLLSGRVADVARLDPEQHERRH